MPCNSDYMYAGNAEIYYSRVACLIDEVDGKPITKEYWNGYHPLVYNKLVSRELGDQLVSRLCERLQKIDVSKQSLEMQIWWRDHQKADKDRLELEMMKKKTADEKAAALAKLTDYERKLLGLK